MLQVTATNFGISPDSIQLNIVQGEGMIILNGELTVDTTHDVYKKLFTLELTVEDLPIGKSLPTAVFVCDATEGSHNITITRARIKDKNTISIRPIRAYDEFGAYRLLFRCAFVEGNSSAVPQFQAHKSIVPEVTLGSMTGAECYLTESEGWAMLVFNAASLTFDETESKVQARLEGFPESVSASFPIIFSESQMSATGSRFYPASIENGVLTISKDGNADEASGVSTKFTKVFIIT